MPAGRTHNARVTALALAVGVNGALLLLLLLSHGAVPAPRPAIATMIWIDPLEPPPRPPRPPEMPPRPRAQVPAAIPVPVPPSDPVQPQPAAQSPSSTAITVPSIDWGEQATRIAQEMAQRGEQTARNPLNSMPEVMVLPKARGYPEGHVEHFEGGVTMSFDGNCATTSNPQQMQPWALDPVGKFFGQSASARWFSKGGGCRADSSSKRAAAMEKHVKPRHLGGTGPPPEEDQSPFAIKIP
jgi:hypothetical protein